MGRSMGRRGAKQAPDLASCAAWPLVHRRRRTPRWVGLPTRPPSLPSPGQDASQALCNLFACPFLGQPSFVRFRGTARSLQAVGDATPPLTMVAGPRGFYRQLKRLRGGGATGGRHADLWHAAAPHLHKVVDAIWVQAHLTSETASHYAEAGGCPVRWHGLNRVAGALVARGVAMHTDDPRGMDAQGVGDAWAAATHYVFARRVSGGAATRATRRRRINHTAAASHGANKSAASRPNGRTKGLSAMRSARISDAGWRHWASSRKARKTGRTSSLQCHRSGATKT